MSETFFVRWQAFQWIVAVRGRNIFVRYETARMSQANRTQEKARPNVQDIFGLKEVDQPTQAHGNWHATLTAVLGAKRR